MVGLTPFLQRVQVTDYRSIAHCDISVPPLLILVGPNAAGKSNFLDALRFVADALDTTPSDAVKKRGGIDELLRRTRRDIDGFRIVLDFMISWDGVSTPVQYGLHIDRDSAGRRTLVVRGEWCEIRGVRDAGTAGFRVMHGLVLDGGGIEQDRLYLPVAATQGVFSEVYRSLRSMLVYQLELSQLRRPQPRLPGQTLDPVGARTGAVLGTIKAEYPQMWRRLNDYVRAIVPGRISVSEQVIDAYSTIAMRAEDSLDGVVFGPGAMSEGTLRAVGLLTALFQPAVLDGQVSLVGIEEPEISLHPAAAGALFDALTEASERVQIVVTTQSPDLLDRDDVDMESVRVVMMSDGVTDIGVADEVSRRLVADNQVTVGELMRTNQLRPMAVE
ncbi:AAA family ATPase [Rhizohabitans arisaemae]|uniref:AAA family ATPase n=1 Tax=Rhizohabitans arisaemae TaxID=2720610 RepID=UPI0024B1BF31|nr:AAA family ATPase [Rhizohabitans arisaemae]